MKKKSRRRRKRTGKVLRLIAGIMGAITFGMEVYMLDVDASGQISEEDFIKCNSAIYEGIEVHNMTTTIISYDVETPSGYPFMPFGDKEERSVVQYQTAFDTAAGNISFENEAFFLKGEAGYKLAWSDSLIYPGLSFMDRIRVSTIQAKRGEILDRNDRILAGPGVTSSVGIVPGKLENKDSAIEQIAELLGMVSEEIEKKLSAKWVKKDSFVPVKTLQKVEEIELMSMEPDEEVIKEYERQQQLLEIQGVMISDTEIRAYPLGDAAAHLVGYVQSVTAEDLEKHAGEGYTASSVIGRSGAEGLFEKELRGQNGCRIYIVDSDGNEKEELACKRQAGFGKLA